MDQQISLESVITFLVATPLFRHLDAAERGQVARIMEVQRLKEGEQVFREGEEGDAWYVVFDGKAKVLKNLSTGPEEIAVLDSGACFGEMAILDGMPRSASVIAAGPLTVFRFRRERFDELLGNESLGAYKLVAAMARTLSQRQRLLTQQVTSLLGRSEPTRVAVEQFQISE
ncbi:MAG TPA: cyclic nucleotide-binding domain-containing protein [Gemmatimonadaceae bacterium]